MYSITVTSFTRAERSITVCWETSRETGCTVIYRHSDGSWHPDPGTAQKGHSFLQELDAALIRFAKGKPKKKAYPKKKKRTVWFAEPQ